MEEEEHQQSDSDEEVLEDTHAARKLTFSVGPHSAPNSLLNQRTSTEVVRGTRQVQNGMGLQFYPPIMKNGKKIVKIIPIEVEAECMKWENALIGYVIGDTPVFEEMLKFVYEVWNFVTIPRVYPHEEGYFTFLFETSEDKDYVLAEGPYTYDNRQMVLKN